jgi:hypothetical protein
MIPFVCGWFLSWCRRTSAAAAWALALGLLGAPTALRADPLEDYALGGLSGLSGLTMVGVGPQGGIWSAYFDPGGQVEFLYSTGERRLGSWYDLSADRVCIRFTAPEAAEVCKRVESAGRGLHWITEGEEKPSSQIIMMFKGKVAADQASYRASMRDWWNTMIVGRIRESRNIWYAVLWPDSTFTFLYTSGKKSSGVYFLYDRVICFKFDSDEATICRTPTVEDGAIRWVGQDTAETLSDIVYLYHMPAPAMAARQGGTSSQQAGWDGGIRTARCPAGKERDLQVACVVAALGEYGCSAGLTSFVGAAELGGTASSVLCSAVAQQMTSGDIDLGVLGINAVLGAMDGAGSAFMNQDGGTYLLGVLMRAGAAAGNLALLGQCLANVDEVCG